ncbi:hypothetical protein DL96DRAFT_1611098 [Flagelloscypha sp. PMI_526]|nr:hypothetical protein DL96DRAFT_1611098 [Flagelloscypha sp. PMI_526]
MTTPASDGSAHDGTEPDLDLSIASNTDLKGRIALISGGGTGIGLLAARAFLANGAEKVYITGRRDDVLKKAVEQYGPKLESIQMDVSDKESIRRAVQHVQQRDGRLDVLYNNAGISGPGNPIVTDTSSSGFGSTKTTLGKKLFEDFNFQEWAELLNINLSSNFAVTNAFLDLLVAGATQRGEGEMSSVIMCSSTGGRTTLALGGGFAYQLAKNSVDHMTKTLALLYAQRGIPVRVNVVAPGLFLSEMTENLPATGVLPGYLHANSAGRIGRPAEITSILVWLASTAADYTNGADFLVDGGHWLMNE